MKRHRLSLVISLSLTILLLSVIAVSCVRDGGIMRNRSANSERSEVKSELGGAATGSSSQDDGSVDVTTVNFNSFDNGDLLFNAVTVERHNLDLPTFTDATIREMEADSRIDITSRRIDGSLRQDGSPVSVIGFSVSDAEVGLQLVGRQYAVVTPDGEGFSIVTCLTDEDVVHQCDDEMRTIDLAAIR